MKQGALPCPLTDPGAADLPIRQPVADPQPFRGPIDRKSSGLALAPCFFDGFVDVAVTIEDHT